MPQPHLGSGLQAILGRLTAGPNGLPDPDKAPMPPGAAVAAGHTRIHLHIGGLLASIADSRLSSTSVRVQLGMLQRILLMEASGSRRRFAFVASLPEGTHLRAVPYARLQDITRAALDPDRVASALGALVDVALTEAMPAEFRGGDTLLLFDLPMRTMVQADLLRGLRRKQVAIGAYVRDVAPASHPEYFGVQVAAAFSQGLFGLLSMLDFAIAASDNTAAELRRLADAAGFGGLPIEVVRPAHTLRDGGGPAGGQADPGSNAGSGAADDLPARPFVLCVGTIEAVKAHRYLFEAWKALLDEGHAVPDLVLVGPRGWGVTDLFAQFDATGWLGGRVRHLAAAGDAELAALYRHCLFTIYPGLLDGWPQPIGESLGAGKLCVAFNTAATPEVGGDLVDYVDPWNLRSGLDVFRALLQSPERLAAAEAKIRTRFRPRGWGQAVRDLLDTVDRQHAAIPNSPRGSLVPVVPSGTVVRACGHAAGLGRDALASAHLRHLLALRCGWTLTESSGYWMKGRTARLQWQSDLGAGQDAVVFLLLLAAPGPAVQGVVLGGLGSLHQHVRTVPGQPVLLHGRTLTDGDGHIGLTVQLDGQAPLAGAAQRIVGLAGFAYAGLTDAVSRAEILEAMLIDRARAGPHRPGGDDAGVSSCVHTALGAVGLC